MERISRIALLAVIFATLTCATVAMGQNTNSGDIRGTVTDPAGAVVPGATVTVTNTDTGVSREFVTNSVGIYDTNSILPGTYTITFSKAGFEKLVKTAIVLQVATITVDGQLAVGATTTEVTVTTTLQALKTEDAQQSTTLATHEMSSLPMVSPESGWMNFLTLLPGSAGSPGYGGGSGSTGNPGIDQEIGGTAPYFSSYLIDGGSIRLPASANVDEEVTESIGELQIVATNASAIYGGGGNVFNLITKSGTNSFHGTAYDYVQNDIFNARDFFNSTGAKGRQRYNYSGGALGGPIRKNKVFFYGIYENRQNPGSSTQVWTAPSEAMKAGCFDPAIFGNKLTLDPAHGSTPLTTNVAQCGAYNPADLAIPTADMDPVALKIQSYYPTQAMGVNQSLLTSNYRFLQASVNPDDKYQIRMDFNLSEKNRIYGTFLQHYNPYHHAYSPIAPIQVSTSRGGGVSAQVTDVYTFSPTLVNEFRFSTVRQTNWVIAESLGKGYPAALGLQFAKADEFPDVDIFGTGGNTTFDQGNDTNAIFIENTFDYSDMLTLIRGKHILHFGGEVLRNQNNSTPWGSLKGAVVGFTGQYTAGTGADVGYADFLLGDVQSWAALSTPDHGTRDWNPMFFAQDDIKVRPNLTVNLGLRWEIHGGFYNQYNVAGGFDPTLTNPITGTLGSMWFAGENGERTKCFKTQYPIVMPRFGIAWTVTNNWVVRGGVGLYSAMWSSDTAGGEIGFGDQSLGTASSPPGTAPVVQLSGTGASLPWILPTRNPAAYNNEGNGFIPYYPYDLKSMEGVQWSGGIQRRLPGNIVLEATYVGAHWWNLQFLADDNQVPANKLGGGQAARPYPQYLSIGIGAGGARTGQFNAISNYDAAEFSLRKPVGHGLTVDTNLTWAVSKDDEGSSGWGTHFGSIYYQDTYNVPANYAHSNFDTPLAFKGALIYAIPLGRGHRYASSPGGDAALGGWQASALWVAQSGAPFNVIMSSNTNSGAICSGCSWYPNLVGNPNVSNPSIAEWYNQLAYATPTTDTFGNNPRNSLRGPDLRSLNFNLSKSFSIPRWEQGKIQFRMDATNILNHPSFMPPNNSLNAVALSKGIPDASVGKISSTTITGRVIQLSARISF